ncbi:MAG: amidohydrolase [Deltaproteobacteria bacterium]|nr:amidohydrolase [Deltaproteobacteria bacterium]
MFSSRRQSEHTFEPDIVVEGGTVLTMCEGQEPLHNSSVLIKGDRILGIHRTENSAPLYENAEVIDASNAIIMPGLVNCHAHTAMTLFRGLADDLPLKQWLFEKIFPAEAEHLDPETVYWGALLGCLEMIASGTTSVVDGYFFQDSTARAFQQAGLRALVAQGVIDFPAPGVPDPKDNLKKGRDFLEKWFGSSDLITPGLFCHSPLTCSQRTLTEARALSDEFSLPLQIHLSETEEEVLEILNRTGTRPVKYLDELGLLSPRLIAAHAIHVDQEEIRILAQRGVKVVHVPESNMKLSSGLARIPEMISSGLYPGVGTDGCASNNDLDLFREMDSLAKVHKVFSMDPVTMTADTVLKMAIVWGARVMDLEKDLGTIEEGKKADMIVVDLSAPHMIPLYSPGSNIVYSANGADVKDVIVNGKVLMKDRNFKTLDAPEIMKEVKRIGRKIAS